MQNVEKPDIESSTLFSSLEYSLDNSNDLYVKCIVVFHQLAS